MEHVQIIQELVENLFSGQIKRGDLIALETKRYRNDGMWIWDGVKVHKLASEVDEYGHIPSILSFPEFPLDYWRKHIAHNYLIPITHGSFIDEMMRNIELLGGYKD